MDVNIDEKLLRECAVSFSEASGIGCSVTDVSGHLIYEHGYSCIQCELCSAASISSSQCVRAQLYGMHEAERFGGRYIYSCNMGMNCFVSPILGPDGSQAQITVGPFRMVDEQDYAMYDLAECLHLSPEIIEKLMPIVSRIPCIDPKKVNALSNMLFMSTGFIQNVSQIHRMENARESLDMNSQITSYIQMLKREEDIPAYPFHLERAFLQCIARGDQKQAQKLLNDLLGHIMFFSGRKLDVIKSRVYELLIMITRTAVEEGAMPERILAFNNQCMSEMSTINDIDSLCIWLSAAIKRCMNEAFNLSEMRDMDIIHRTVQYMQLHYSSKTTLEEIAQSVYLSPTYLCRLFKKKTGCTVMQFYTNLRIGKCKELLQTTDKMLSTIAQETGFEDQSYFTKVFKRIVGMTPLMYRKKSQRIDI